MLTANFINAVRNLPPSEVIGHYITLKHNGANYKGPCPFHDEKSASFVVSDTKEMYKCFGCGRSGDAINFVIEHEKLTFVEACEQIGSVAGIPVEFEDSENSEQYKAALSAAQAQEQVLNIVIPLYQQQLHNLPGDHPARLWMSERGITADIIDQWQLGWSPEDWRFVAPRLVADNLFEPAEKLGVIKRNKADDGNYDGYRSRIIFPITNKHGRFIGLGGRYIKINPKDSADIPKYINPAQCELYSKSNVLYGLKQATKAIRDNGHVYIVEGYMDVVSPHRAGTKNVVATCGTAFTVDQIKALRQHTSHFILWRDTDAAGITATVNHLPELYKQGITVQVVKYDAKDPDDFVQKTDTYNHAGQQWQVPELVDGILWYASHRWQNVEEIHQRARAKGEILEMVAKVRDEIYHTFYLEKLNATYNWKPGDTKKEFASILKRVVPVADVQLDTEEDEDSDSKIKFAEWVSEEQKEMVLSRGFLAVNRKHQGKPMVGYYTFTTSGKTEITNFIITPLFRIKAGIDSRYMLQVNNGYDKAVYDMPAKVMPSVDQFQSYTVSDGSFMIYGSKIQWLRIMTELLRAFLTCVEIKHLGWQRYKFYAFVDKVFVPGVGVQELDQWGIIKAKPDDSRPEENFLVPASSEAYKQLQHNESDPYENDRVFTYRQSPVTFQTWAKQMHLVYAEKGPVGIAAVIMAVFRDLVFAVDNNCPHMYAFGEPSSGKSKWAESCTAMFFVKRAAFNLNSGTDFAFFSYMQRFNNTLAHLNEFDIDVIKPEWFQNIKGVYDGEGRERGSMKAGARNQTEIMKVNSVLFLTGQKLVTADDNSVVSRSIIEPFSVVENRTDESQQNYLLLKSWEEKGLSSMLVEILQLRKEFETGYNANFNGQLGIWRRGKSEARSLNQRILQNFGHLATCYTMAAKHIAMPVEAEEFTDYCYRQAIRWSNFIKNSDTLSEFWRTLEYFVSENAIENGWDYLVVEEMGLKIRNGTEEKQIDFDQPTKLLYLRVNNVHKKFETAYRNRTGSQAMSLDNLLHYFSSRKYFVGPVKQKRFSRYVVTNSTVNGSIVTQRQKKETITSCYAFLYDDLGISIEAFDGNAPDEPPEAGKVTEPELF